MLLRVHLIAVGSLGPAFSSSLLLLFAVLSAVVAVPFVLVQRDLKRLLAYSSIEHIGLIAAAIGIGGPLALFSAALHLLGHAIGKALLFFAAGNIAQRYDTHVMGRIAGAASSLPFSGGALLLGSLALAGAPPSVLFTSELGLLAAGFERERSLGAIVLLACLALVFAGLIYHTARLTLGGSPARVRRGESRPVGLLLGVPLVGLVLLGLWIPVPLVAALEQVAQVLKGA
jgi:hydrogenase-4 component F